MKRKETPLEIRIAFWLNVDGSPKNLKESSLELTRDEESLFACGAEKVKLRGATYEKSKRPYGDFAELSKAINPFRELFYERIKEPL